jgi:GH18 family chitinase
MAFMNSATFNREEGNSTWPLFMSVAEARPQFQPDTKILVAIGGWGDTDGFAIGARTPESRAKWARNVAAMVADTGADGKSPLPSMHSFILFFYARRATS